MINSVDFNRDCVIQGKLYKKGTIYLAGPIAHADATQQNAWRVDAAEKLEAKGLVAVSPLGKEDWEGRLIVSSDLIAVERCNAMLAWVPPDMVSFGTSCEVFYKAWVLGMKEKVVVWGQENLRDPVRQSPFLYENCAHLCATLDEALKYILDNINLFRE